MSNRYENILKTCKEMMEARNFKLKTPITKVDKINQNYMIFSNENENDICLFLEEVYKVGVDMITEYISLLNEIDICHCIIIYNTSITPTAKKVINDNRNNIIIELFQGTTLTYNITKHVLVPKHIKLSSEECKKIKNKIGNNIPILYTTDPVSMFYNFLPGNIIKICRKDNSISYRIVKKP